LSAKVASYAPVSLSVLSDLLSPELSVGGRRGTPRAIVAVPKASVNEDDALSFSDNDVGATGEIPYVNAVAITEAVQQLPDH